MGLLKGRRMYILRTVQYTPLCLPARFLSCVDIYESLVQYNMGTRGLVSSLEAAQTQSDGRHRC